MIWTISGAIATPASIIQGDRSYASVSGNADFSADWFHELQLTCFAICSYFAKFLLYWRLQSQPEQDNIILAVGAITNIYSLSRFSCADMDEFSTGGNREFNFASTSPTSHSNFGRYSPSLSHILRTRVIRKTEAKLNVLSSA